MEENVDIRTLSSHLLATLFLSLPSSSTSISSFCWLPNAPRFWLCTVLTPKLFVLLVRLLAVPSVEAGLGVTIVPGLSTIITACRLFAPAPMNTVSRDEGIIGSGLSAVGVMEEGMLVDCVDRKGTVEAGPVPAVRSLFSR